MQEVKVQVAKVRLFFQLFLLLVLFSLIQLDVARGRGGLSRKKYTLQQPHCNIHGNTHMSHKKYTLQHTHCNIHTATRTLQHTHCNIHGNTHTATYTLQHTHCNTHTATYTATHTFHTRRHLCVCCSVCVAVCTSGVTSPSTHSYL